MNRRALLLMLLAASLLLLTGAGPNNAGSGFYDYAKFVGGVMESALDMNGQDIITDVDGDSKFELSADDVIALELSGSTAATFATTGLTMVGNLNAVDIIASDQVSAATFHLPNGTNMSSNTNDGNFVFMNAAGTEGICLDPASGSIVIRERTCTSTAVLTASVLKSNSIETGGILDAAGVLNVGVTTCTNTGAVSGQDAVCFAGEANFDTDTFHYGETNLYGQANVGSYTFTEDAGAVDLFDMSVSETPTAGDEMSANARIDGNLFMSWYSEADSTGGLQNERIDVFKHLVVSAPYVHVPAAETTMAAGDTLTVTHARMPVRASGSITLTSTPHLTVGDYDGQQVIIKCGDGVITFQDDDNLGGSGMKLNADTDFACGIDMNLVGMWSASDTTWHEISRSAN